MIEVLRQAARADVDGMLRVRGSVRENRLVSGVITAAQVVDAIERTGRGWVVERDGEVVAFGIANRDQRNIWALFVHPDHERQGLGRRLHDAMLAWLAEHGPGPVWLSTDPGTRAQAFYQAAGWTPAGTTASGEVRFQRVLPPVAVGPPRAP